MGTKKLGTQSIFPIFSQRANIFIIYNMGGAIKSGLLFDGIWRFGGDH